MKATAFVVVRQLERFPIYFAKRNGMVSEWTRQKHNAYRFPFHPERTDADDELIARIGITYKDATTENV